MLRNSEKQVVTDEEGGRPEGDLVVQGISLRTTQPPAQVVWDQTFKQTVT